MSNFNKFKLKGNVSTAIRSDEDLKCIDKSQAEIVFKTQKKRLDDFLQTYGFVKYKGRAYVRWNKIDVLEYIDVQKESYGSKTFTVNYSLIPLYVPHDFLSFDLGDRLGVLLAGKDVWWDYSEEKIADISFSNVIDAISGYLLPWFEKNSHRDVLQKSLLKEKEKRESHGGRLSDTQQLWVSELMEPVNESIVQENMRVFKLPAKLKRENG